MKRYVLIFLGIGLTVFLLYYLGQLYSPGSYGNAETYELNIGEEDLIELIKDFKEENPEFNVPRQSQLSDHRNNHWYVIYFYYQQENEIVYTWTRPSGKDKTTFALISVVDGRMAGKWKDINKDLNRAENEEQIDRFEALILKAIKEKIDDN